MFRENNVMQSKTLRIAAAAFSAMGLGVVLASGTPVFDPSPDLSTESSTVEERPSFSQLASEDFQVSAFSRDGHLIPATFHVLYNLDDLQSLPDWDAGVFVDNVIRRNLQAMWKRVTGQLTRKDFQSRPGQGEEEISAPEFEKAMSHHGALLVETVEAETDVLIRLDEYVIEGPDFKPAPEACKMCI
jgi:hypothetical protein